MRIGMAPAVWRKSWLSSSLQTTRFHITSRVSLPSEITSSWALVCIKREGSFWREGAPERFLEELGPRAGRASEIGLHGPSCLSTCSVHEQGRPGVLGAAFPHPHSSLQGLRPSLRKEVSKQRSTGHSSRGRTL